MKPLHLVGGIRVHDGPRPPLILADPQAPKTVKTCENPAVLEMLKPQVYPLSCQSHKVTGDHR